MNCPSRPRLFALAAGLLLVFLHAEPAAAQAPAPALAPGALPAFQIRKGYKVTVAASEIGKNVRFMETDGAGTLFVSHPARGEITALKDKDGDGVYETATPFLADYKQVHSMCWDNGWLYATSSNDGSCKRARDTNGDGTADEIEDFLPAGSIPKGGGHPFRGIVFTKDHLYISVSDPGNLSSDLPSENKCIYRFDRDGTNRMQFVTGIRNTEKLRLRPGTEEIWGLDHGSDNFGEKYGESKGNKPITDLIPGEELNKFVEGNFYGHPFLSNNRIVRPEFADRKDLVELAAKTTPPEWVFGAHMAGNGFTFLAKDYFPDHQGDLFAAFHGSWNSSKRVGYCVTRVLFDKETGRPYGTLPIVTCLDGERPLARPVDCLEAPDGSVLFSCDMTNRVYRISKAD